MYVPNLSKVCQHISNFGEIVTTLSEALRDCVRQFLCTSQFQHDKCSSAHNSVPINFLCGNENPGLPNIPLPYILHQSRNQAKLKTRSADIVTVLCWGCLPSAPPVVRCL
jgi:hypothetical protein